MFERDDISIRLSLLKRTLVDSPDLALLVQELTLPHRFTIQNIIEILPLCLNLVSLLVWNDETLDLSHNNALRRLSCFPTLFPPALELDDLPPPAFVQLTHLDLIIAEGATCYPLLAGLTCLSHLCTDLPKVDADIAPLIGHLPPSLVVCILFEEWPHGDDISWKRSIASGELDHRIVFATSEHIELLVPYIYREVDGLWHDWAKFGSGTTLWDEAELIIKNRRDATNEVGIFAYQNR